MGNQVRILRLCIACSSIALLAAGAANAQTEAAGDRSVEAVVVTGSRLQTAGFAAPTPVSVLGAQAIAARAPTVVIDALYDVPAFKQNSGANQSQRTASGVAFATVDLRGLGATRTLVLVNGRRQVASTTANTFDTNRIPTGLVDRIDVVTGGASAAYGSDAVAGVVNFVLNDRLIGGKMSAQYGVSQEGDNDQRTVNIAYGKAFADGRVHVVGGLDYTKNDGTGTIYSRAWGRKEPGILAIPAPRAAGVPAQVWANNVEYSLVTPGSIVVSGPLRGTAFDLKGAPYAFQFGTLASNLMTGSVANYGNNPNGQWKLVQPVERATAMVRASYDVADETSVFGDLSYTALSSHGQAGVIQFPGVIVSVTNPYLPAATRAAMVAANQTTLTLGYLGSAFNPLELLPTYPTENAAYTLQGNVGIKGKILDDYSWDLTYSRGVSRAESTFLGAPYGPNFLAAVNAVAGPGGTVECGPIATNPNLTAAQRLLVLPGCQPFNIFGTDVASQAARNYVSRQTHSLTTNRQDVFALNVSGTPVSTWAGPVSLAAGVEYRRETLSVQGEGYDSTAFAFGGTTTYGGKQSVKEAYIEGGIPLLKDVALAKSLDLNVALRRTDYSITGPVTTWKAGLVYDVNDWIRFRATESRDIRAPNLNELYNKGARGTTNNFRNPFNGQTGQLFSTGGGNPSLQPEVAITYTGGLVLQPQWAWTQGFRASVDYYSIKLKGVVASVGAGDIVNRCFAGVLSYCPAITNDTSVYGIANVVTSTYNLNKLYTNGVDIELSYRVPLESLPGDLPGRLNVRALGAWVDDLTTTDLAGVAVDRAGSGQGLPEWSWNLTFDYAVGSFSGFLQARYMSELNFDPTLKGPNDPNYNAAASNSVSKNLWPAMVYWNASASYKLKERIELFGTVNNLFDKAPPEYAVIAFSTVGQSFQPYDLIGRMYKAGVRITF